MNPRNPATKPHVILLSAKSGRGSVEVAAELARLLESRGRTTYTLHFLLDLEHHDVLTPVMMGSLMDSINQNGRVPIHHFILGDALTKAEFNTFGRALRIRIDCEDEQTRRRLDFVEHRRDTPDELGELAQAQLFDMVFSTEKNTPVEIARAIVLKLAQGKGPK